MRILQSNKSLSKIALALAALCALGFLSSGLGVRVELWNFRTGFSLLKWSAYLVGIPTALIMIDFILAKVQNRPVFMINSLLVLVIAAIVFGTPYFSRQQFQKIPTIADITTDFDDAPEFLELISARESTSSNPLRYRGKAAIKRQQKYFPKLKSIFTKQSPAKVIKKAASIAKKWGFQNISSTPEKGRLEATETTFWFGFKDDLVVRAKRIENGKTKVDIRSASRVGYLDGGLNAQRVAKLHQQLSQ